MSGIATSLSRYTPIYNSPFSYSLNLGARFLLGGRIVTTTSRTVRTGPADGPPEVMPRYLSGRSWDPLVISLFFLFSSGARAPAPSSPLTSISLLRPPNLDSLRGNLPRHLLHLPKPLNRLLTAGIAPATARHHWRCLKLAPPSIRLSGRPPLEPTAGMDSW